MEKIKLFELLEKFSPKEFENFSYFLNSPLHNKSENAIKLYNISAKYYPEFSDEQLTKEKIFKKIYPGEIFKDKKIRDLFSHSLSLAEEFLALMTFREDVFLKNQISFNELGKKELTKHFTQKSKEIESELAKKEYRDSDYFYYNYQFLKRKRTFFETKEISGNRKEYHHDVNKEIDQYILCFIYNMLDYYSHQYNHEIVIKQKAHFEMIDELLAYLGKRNLESYPEIKIVYYKLLLEKYPDNDEYFYELRNLINMKNIKLETDIHRAVYVHLYNFAKLRTLRGDSNFKKVHFDIIKETIEKEMYPVEDGYLPANAYGLIAFEGLVNKEYEWTKDFIEKYIKLVRPEHSESAYYYANAIYNYRIKNYDKALKFFAKIKPEDHSYALNIKNNILKIYFETEQYDAALNLVDSFRHFVNSNKLMPDYVKIRFVSYISFMGRILNSILNKESKTLVNLRNEILNTENLENQTWMLEQLDNLLKA